MNEDDNSLLITLVQSYPHLYDKKDPSFKDIKKKENSWVSISEVLQVSVNECQTRWKSLRDRYGREKKKLDPPSGSGAITISENSRQLLSSMNFLETVVHHRKTTGNYKSSVISSVTAEQSQNQVTDVHPELTLALASKSVSLPQPIAICPRKMACNSEQSAYKARRTINIPLHSPPADRPLDSPHNQYICSPAATPSPGSSFIESTPSTSRCRSISSNSEDNDNSSISPEASLEDDQVLNETLNRPNSNNTVNNRMNTHGKKRKSIRNEDVNTALISALSSLKKIKPTPQETPKADQLFADCIAAELQRFPPRKKNLVKGEILRLISEFDDKELE